MNVRSVENKYFGSTFTKNKYIYIKLLYALHNSMK